MTSGTHPWSFVTHIFHNDQPSHGGGSKQNCSQKKKVKLSYTRTREIRKEALSSVGLKVVDFELNSLRFDRVGAAYSCRVSDSLFKIHGRCKS